MSLPDELKNVVVNLEIQFNDSSVKEDVVEIGHEYPHEIADRLSKSVLTAQICTKTVRSYGDVGLTTTSMKTFFKMMVH